MPNALEAFTEFIGAHADLAPALLEGATEFMALLQPKVAVANQSIAQFLGAIDDPMVLRQLADGVNLAQIAGAKGVSIEAILQATVKLVGMARLITGAA